MQELALRFWGETEVECFDREYDVLKLPAFVGLKNDDVAGFVSYEVVPSRIAEHHGGLEKGFAGIPVRDEIRMQFALGGEAP